MLCSHSEPREILTKSLEIYQAGLYLCSAQLTLCGHIHFDGGLGHLSYCLPGFHSRSPLTQNPVFECSRATVVVIVHICETNSVKDQIVLTL